MKLYELLLFQIYVYNPETVYNVLKILSYKKGEEVPMQINTFFANRSLQKTGKTGSNNMEVSHESSLTTPKAKTLRWK